MSTLKVTYKCDNCEKELENANQIVLCVQHLKTLANGNYFAVSVDLCEQCFEQFRPLIEKMLPKMVPEKL